MVDAQSRICPGEWDAQSLLLFWDTNGSPNPGQTIGPYNKNQPKKKKKKKRTCRIVKLAVPADHWVKLNESEKEDKNLDLARELETKVEHESDNYTNCNWCSWHRPQKIGKRTRGFRKKRKSGDNPNYSLAEISQNTEKSPGVFCERPSTNSDVKNSQGVIIIKIIILFLDSDKI